jgi:hypothetical protein
MKQRRPSLLTVRAPRNTEQGCRIRRLYRSFIAPLVAGDPVHEAAALAAAELIVAAEVARARLLAGDPDAEAATVRLENSARRAKLDLATLKPTPLSWWQQRQQEEAENAEDE